MADNVKNIQSIFEKSGGKFLLSDRKILQKLDHIKAFIFDWDGVFNNAQKDAGGSSNFNEADSMGTNLLRFGYFLQHGRLPLTAIISGEKNETAFYFCTREHFTSSYYKIANKIDAIHHFCQQHNISPKEIAYVFDDVLDLCVAEVCGIRILIKRNANPLFTNYVIENNLADYITAHESGNFAVREVCELLMGLYNNYDKIISERTRYSAVYKEYIEKRNCIETTFFTRNGNTIVPGELKPIQNG